MGSEQSSTRGPRYRTFAWQGVQLTLPTDWNLTVTRGDRKAGYLRLSDEYRTRLEVRWQQGKRQGLLSRTVDGYIEKLRKDARKEKVSFSVQRGLKLASPPGKEVECYRWTGRQQALAMLSWCPHCRRTTHLHLLGEPEESLKNLARTVFSSFRDHCEGADELWAFYDMRFRAPAGWPLKRHSLKAGLIRMSFGGRGRSLEFIRVSLAGTLLAAKSLAEWFGEFYGKPLKRKSFRITEQTVKGHDGLMLRGETSLFFNPLKVFGRRRVLRAACWHCEPKNRLMICALDAFGRQSELFESVLAEFDCCERSLTDVAFREKK